MGNLYDSILVAIYCTTYNHEPYIRQCLDGFVMQETDFKFVAIVHDDASTDRTATIVREYADKYPDIIKPIYETENQYSKKDKSLKRIMEGAIEKTGCKYVAFCEGDDYWIDPCKLQKQVDFLDLHPDYVAVVGNTILYDVRSGKEKIRYSNNDKDVLLSDVIFGGAEAFHISSLMYRKVLQDNSPDFLKMIPDVGDYPLAIYLNLCGKVRYFGCVLSVYRYMSLNSWSQRNNNVAAIERLGYSIEMLNSADSFSGYRFHALFDKAIRYKHFTIAVLQNDLAVISHFPEFYKTKSIIWKFRFLMKTILVKLHLLSSN